MPGNMQAQYMQLKWTRLGGNAPFILAKDEATCLAASDKLHSLGCGTGTVHVLDFEGNRVRIKPESNQNCACGWLC